MRTTLITAAGVTLAALTLTNVSTGAPEASILPAAATNDSSFPDKLRGGLREVLADAPPDELIPVIIALEAQIDPNLLDRANGMRDKSLRRELVVGALKDVAARTQGDLLALLRDEQQQGGAGDRLESLWITNVVGTDLTAEAIRRVALRGDVAYLYYDPAVGGDVFPVEPVDNPNPGGNPGGLDDPQEIRIASAIECGVAVMGAPQVWNDLNITGRGAVVGIIDTGACITHPDLRNQIWVNEDEIEGNGIDDDNNGFIDDIHGWSFDRNGSDNNITDTNGHGTHTTGTVAGDGTNGTTTGMAPDVAMMILKFYNNVGGGQTSVWNCMQYGVDNGANVLTASLGWLHRWNPDRRRWREVCEAAIAAGVVVIYAAGNEGSCCPPFDHTRTPGDVPLVITVGATDCNDRIASFSSRGPVTWQNIDPWRDWPYPPGKIKPSISAPGVGTISTSNNCSSYRALSGTSMATPHVAGAVALMLEADPNLDHEGVKQILMDTAVDLGADGIDNVFGAGRVDAFAAVVAALEGGATPADLVDFSIVQGRLIRGDLEALRASDDVRVITNSEFGFLINEPNVTEMVVGLVTEVQSPTDFDISVESRVNSPGGTASFHLRNWSTGAFEQVHEYPLRRVESTESIEGVDATDYVRGSDGKIELSIKHVIVATFTVNGFRSRFDLVEAPVR